jgi:hypothetical protein
VFKTLCQPVQSHRRRWKTVTIPVLVAPLIRVLLPLELQVDGTTVQTLAFDATGGWTTWGDQTGELSLTEGTHVI